MKRLRYKRFWAVVLLPLSMLLLRLAAACPGAVERLYARGLYPVLAATLGRMFSLFPLSVAELLLIAGILCGIRYIIRLVRCLIGQPGSRIAPLTRLVANLGCAAGVAALLFTLFCGLNYHRHSFARQSGLDTVPSHVEELLEMCLDLAAETNAARQLVAEDGDGVMALSKRSPYQLARDAQRLYNNASALYPQLGGYTARPKPLLLSRGMSYLDLGGIYIPFTFEPNVNADMPDYGIPATMMHELSHFKGFMREEEANFLSYLACRESGDPDFIYSGNMLALVHSTNALYRTDSELYWIVYDALSQGVRDDLAASSAYWRQFEGPVAEVSSAVNDTYLKANRQTDGVRSYGQMVDLLLAWWRAVHRG